MTTTALSITYTQPAATDDAPLDLLQIEQDEWAAALGQVTKIQAIRRMLNTFYGQDNDDSIDCGLTGNSLIVAVYVYPATPDLAYQLHTSWGTLSDRLTEELEKTELVNFELADTASPEYPATEILSVEPVGEAYDSDGVLTDMGTISVVDQELAIDAAVWGAAKVTYTCIRHTYILNAEARDDAVEDLFGAVVYGLYDGGLNYLEIDEPPNADELAMDDAECGYGGGTGDIVQPVYLPPDDTGVDRYTTIGLCTGDKINDRLVVTYGV